MRVYALHDRVYCARCVAEKPTELVDDRYGKIRVGWSERDGHGNYRCLARDRGYHQCAQPMVADFLIDQQVIQALSALVIPEGFKERVESAVRSRVENEAALKRMAEIEEIVKRIDFSWEQGFLAPQDYVEKRSQLQKEMEALRPIDYDSLMEAADLVEHFGQYWGTCYNVENPETAHQQLLAKIVDRVFVYDKSVVAVALHGDFGVVLDAIENIPVEIGRILSTNIDKKTGATPMTTGCAQGGADGVRLCAGELFLSPRRDYTQAVYALLEGVA
jgi:hypothetical protein